MIAITGDRLALNLCLSPVIAITGRFTYHRVSSVEPRRRDVIKLPPFKVLEKVLEWTFLKSSGKLSELIEFCASSGKNKGSSGKSLKKFWKEKSSGKSMKKFWKT